MKGIATKTVEITLTLTEYEAMWLKNYVQNFYESEGQETKKGMAIRKDLFCILKERLDEIK